jgi:hypothetical protein
MLSRAKGVIAGVGTPDVNGAPVLRGGALVLHGAKGHGSAQRRPSLAAAMVAGAAEIRAPTTEEAHSRVTESLRAT